MSLTKEKLNDGKLIRLSIEGLFDFSLHKQFLSSYKDESGKMTAYEIDLQQTSYIDSSALGMLLLLREHAGGESAEVTITHPNQDVLKVLQIANFDKIFQITP